MGKSGSREARGWGSREIRRGDVQEGEIGVVEDVKGRTRGGGLLEGSGGSRRKGVH